MKSKKRGKILVVDDQQDILTSLQILLKRHMAKVSTERDPHQMIERLKAERFDMVLLDLNFSKKHQGGEEGFYWLKAIKDLDPDMVVMIITAFGDVETAVTAMKNGASDFILKPWVNEKLVATLNAGLALRRSQKRVTHLEQVQKQLLGEIGSAQGELLGISPAMERIRKTIDKVAATHASVLILGENGTGKELVAAALHQGSQRASGPFVTVDMGALTESLFESECFGHMKGAFTGAVENRIGRFELASGGTLFLDEIGNLGSMAQAKLLTVLQRREIIRVGSNRARSVDFRLVCATNMPLYQMVEPGEFRQDLLYRINTLEITIPPLRDRREDISVLAEHFLEKCCLQYRKPLLPMSSLALDKLRGYHWPGNVRELEHVIERAVILSEQREISADDILLSGQRRDREPLEIADCHLESLEKAAIARALDKHQRNISRAAKELGLTRATLYRKMARYGY